MSQTAKHIIFIGCVQGVGFRYTANRIAARYAVTGFVRNLSDGTVEMLVQGLAEDVDACIDDIKESFAAEIRDVEITTLAPNPRHANFRITF